MVVLVTAPFGDAGEIVEAEQKEEPQYHGLLTREVLSCVNCQCGLTEGLAAPSARATHRWASTTELARPARPPGGRGPLLVQSAKEATPSWRTGTELKSVGGRCSGNEW